MRIRWRQYEIMLAIIVLLVLWTDDLTKAVSVVNGMSAQELAFATAGVKYNYFLNTLLPFLLRDAVPIGLLIALTGRVVPRLAQKPVNAFRILFVTIATWFIIALAHLIAFRLRFENLIPTMPHKNELLRSGIVPSMVLATLVVGCYLPYVCIRELIIARLSLDAHRNRFNIVLCNRIVAVGFAYFGFLFFMVRFGFLVGADIFIFYVFVLLPVIINMFINVFGLLPYRARHRIAFRNFFGRLLIAPTILSLTVYVLFIMATNNFAPILPVMLWLMNVAVSLPLSVLLFRIGNEDRALMQLKSDLDHRTADLSFLRSQINPHFLFNTLNTLYGTSLQEDAPRTSTGIQKLGDMMRFLLHESQLETIPLSRELAYLKDFISLQRLRIDESSGAVIETDIRESGCLFAIAPMLLIPFVENAFKHGIRVSRSSYIRLRISCNDRGISMDIANSVHAHHDDEFPEQQSGIGLQNVKDRLNILYQNKHRLIIDQTDSGFHAQLFIELAAPPVAAEEQKKD